MQPNLRMLVVDDDEELRRSVFNQFSDEGFLVDTAEDGNIAIEKIQSNNYDLVLLDLKLPTVSGKHVLKEMRLSGKFPLVIILSALNDIPTAHECMKLGAKDYITKPYDPEELLHIVIKSLSV